MMQEREVVSRLIHLSGRLLDQEEFIEYASLYSERGEYRLVTKAPEVRQPMTWALMSREELSALLVSTDKHVWNTGQRSHLITVETVDVEGNVAESKSGFRWGMSTG